MPDLDVAVTVSARGVDATFGIGAGEVLALIGPNGAGKSTVAGVIAGLVPARSARVRVGARTIADTDLGIDVPTHNRRVVLLQQNPLLFPHLTVRDNVAFAARRTRGARRTDARTRAMAWLEEVGAAGLAARRPAELSGGEAQRVAIARALAAEPEVLLLDEPLSGLDVAAAAAVRTLLGRTLASGDRATLLITHDVLDVAALADRVAVLEGGAVAECGSTAAVLAAPRSRFAARIAGLNMVRGVLTAPGVLRDAGGQIWHATTPGEPADTGSAAVAVFSPASVAVYRDRPEGSPRNGVRVRIDALESVGAAVRIRAVGQPGGDPGLAADVTPDAVAALRLGPGEDVWFTVKTQAITVHPAMRKAVPPR